MAGLIPEPLTIAGVGAGLGLSLVMQGQGGDETVLQPYSLSYDRVTVTGVRPNNGPISGNITLTILGANFGAFDNSPLAKVESTSCQSSVWVSSSTVLCKVRTTL